MNAKLLVSQAAQMFHTFPAIPVFYNVVKFMKHLSVETCYIVGIDYFLERCFEVLRVVLDYLSRLH